MEINNREINTKLESINIVDNVIWSIVTDNVAIGRGVDGKYCVFDRVSNSTNIASYAYIGDAMEAAGLFRKDVK